jgi:hypothetical protein
LLQKIIDVSNRCDECYACDEQYCLKDSLNHDAKGRFFGGQYHWLRFENGLDGFHPDIEPEHKNAQRHHEQNTVDETFPSCILKNLSHCCPPLDSALNGSECDSKISGEMARRQFGAFNWGGV